MSYTLILAFIALYLTSCKKKEIVLTPSTSATHCSDCFSHHLPTSLIDSNNTNGFISFDYFVDSSGNVIDSTYNWDSAAYIPMPLHQISNIGNKTSKGYYGPAGFQPAQIKLDYNRLLGLSFMPKKISFTVSGYSRISPKPTDVEYQGYNIKLPGTPLIVDKVDNLPARLAPYGYSVQVYHYNSITSMGFGSLNFGDMADSIVISGSDVSVVTIGLDFIETEIRNICVYP